MPANTKAAASLGTPRKATSKVPKRSAKPTSAKRAKPRSQDAGAGTQQADDWRGAVLAKVRRLIREADPDVVEETKWRKPSNAMQGVPVWSHDGMICTGETYKDKVKFTFAKGAALDDPAGLFNANDTGNTRRAIDVRAADRLDEAAFKALFRQAVAHNSE